MSSVVASEIALFPLPTVLFPHARIALQIFEPRYMDLVKSCLRAELGFGVILIASGSEVYQLRQWQRPELVATGCYARIVDWDAMPQGRLGLVLEGQQRFRLLDSVEGSDHLLRGSVDWLDSEHDQPLPQQFEPLQSLLLHLARHPSIQQLHMPWRDDSALYTANQLAQLLPIAPQDKQQLLALDSAIDRLQLIDQLLSHLQA
jgi:hypothetical protein